MNYRGSVESVGKMMKDLKTDSGYMESFGPFSSHQEPEEECRPKRRADWVKCFPIKDHRLNSTTMRNVAQARQYFNDYYSKTMEYLTQRSCRMQQLKSTAAERRWTAEKFNSKWKQLCASETAELRMKRIKQRSIRPQDFNIHAQIGQGGYGYVYLARHQPTGKICALKRMEKRLLCKMNESEHILHERDILTISTSPWLVQLLSAFQDTQNIYLALEYVPGGDFRTFINKAGVLRDGDARFYAAEMFVAVNELHKLGYIHRDIKPENFLLDSRGHVKLTDFGLAANVKSDQQHFWLHNNDYQSSRSMSGRAFSLVGSPDYLAPELIDSADFSARMDIYTEGYDYLVDYWSLGCMIFEMLSGYPPFFASDNSGVWYNLFHWQETLRRPHYEGADEEFNLTDAAWSFVTSLITHKHKRLQTFLDVQRHEWFTPMNDLIRKHRQSLINNGVAKIATVLRVPVKKNDKNTSCSDGDLWRDLRSLPESVLKPPYVPRINDELDHGHFDDFSQGADTKAYKQVVDKLERLEASSALDEGSHSHRTNDDPFRNFEFSK